MDKKTKIARYALPDGRIAKFEVPADTTPEQAQKIGEDYFNPKGGEPGFNARNPQSVMVNPAEGMDWGDAALAGAGARMGDYWLGLKQRFGQEHTLPLDSCRLLFGPKNDTYLTMHKFLNVTFETKVLGDIF